MLKIGIDKLMKLSRCSGMNNDSYLIFFYLKLYLKNNNFFLSLFPSTFNQGWNCKNMLKNSFIKFQNLSECCEDKSKILILK